ncbi:hypothetical protein L7F22_047490 [Adiantum nelumboides]|nr:hypothetical protein [Adiantum nelumboides]
MVKKGKTAQQEVSYSKDTTKSTLPANRFLSSVFLKEQGGVLCFLTLPSNGSVRQVGGEICELEAAAKRAVCLKACKTLHLNKALMDNLPPTNSKKENAGDLVNLMEL